MHQVEKEEISKIKFGNSNLKYFHNQSAEAEQGARAELEGQNGGKKAD